MVLIVPVPGHCLSFALNVSIKSGVSVVDVLLSQTCVYFCASSTTRHGFFLHYAHTLYVHHIMQTCPYNVDPLAPHFYIVKLGFTGVYFILLFLL